MEQKQNKPLTLGSLFSGSGGFELGAKLVGIKPVWNSEIEPFPIRVTTKRMPDVKHLGDVASIKGDEIEPVDIITFGSPCQDLSIAGKRAGLSGSRSNLFYEATRIVKEMREVTCGEKPRYIVWENVPGAFSSNKGEDFFSVLKEICEIKGYKIDEFRPNKWQNAGLIMADDFSLAWRVFDAQYFGVPQRRRRIYLVCDFNGQSAGKILFESEGMSWHLEKSKCPWKRVAEDTKRGTYDTVCFGVDGYNSSISSIQSTLGQNCGQSTGRNGVMVLQDQGGERMDIYTNKSGTITASAGNHPPLVFENHGQDSRFKGPIDVSNTIGASLGTGGNNQPFVVENKKCFDVRLTSENTKNHRANIYETDVSRTINTGLNSPDANQGGLAIVYSTSKNSHHTDAVENLANTLVASDYKDPPIVNDVEGKSYIVRRLTPKECGRLQGFPDGWCDGLDTENPTEEELAFWTEVFETYRKLVTKATKPKSEKQIRNWLRNPHSDSAEYKMWGNGVALPNVCFVLSGIKHFYFE